VIDLDYLLKTAVIGGQPLPVLPVILL